MLAGKTALITGAAGDLGNAMARHLAKNGAHVVMWDIQATDDAAAEYCLVDVRSRAAVDQAMKSITRLDIVCSNAGIVQAQPFLEATSDNWQNHIDVNLTGTLDGGCSLFQFDAL